MSAWLDQMFDAKIVKKEGLVRRNKVDVDTNASRDELVAKVKEKNYHLIETGEQYVVLCNEGAVTIWC